MPPQQTRLFPATNPLATRFPSSFFKNIPQKPGVYRFLNKGGDVLYVGKAKNLRSRIRSYRSAKPETAQRKVLRMLRLVRKIEWEECSTEKVALLKENQLLRNLKPPFNRINTRPEFYYFIKLDFQKHSIGLELTTKSDANDGELFGVFKGRMRTREAFAGLCRLAWWYSQNSYESRLPAELSIRSKRERAEIQFQTKRDVDGFLCLLRGFLLGSSRVLLDDAAMILESERVTGSSFQSFLLQSDIEKLEEFYRFGPHRNYRICRNVNRSELLIGQEEIDDFIVLDQPAPSDR